MPEQDDLFFYNNVSHSANLTVYLYCQECEEEVEVSQLLFMSPPGIGQEEYKAFVKPHKCGGE